MQDSQTKSFQKTPVHSHSNLSSVFFDILLMLTIAGIAIVYHHRQNTYITRSFSEAVSLALTQLQSETIAPGIDGWLFFKPELSYTIRSIPVDNLACIVEFDRILKTHNLQLIVVPIPNKIDIYPEKFSTIVPSVPLHKGRKSFIEDLESQGVCAIDLVPVFNSKKHVIPIFDKYDSHWTPAATALAAQVIGKSITSLYNLQQTTHYTIHDTTLNTTGDLYNKLHQESPAMWYPIDIPQIYNPDGSAFCDDPLSDVIILGDSFVDRGRWWNSQLGAHLASTLGHPTRTIFSLNANTGAPLFYYRHQNAFPKRGVVVWAFTSRVLQWYLKTPTDTPGIGQGTEK